jgi:predicted RNA-binding Zn ribbon-like protein
MDISPDAPLSLPQFDFIFLGGNLALDLVNTKRSRRVPGSRRIIQFDQLYDLEQLGAWWKEACARHGLARYEACVWTAEDFALLIELRAELRDLFETIIAECSAKDGAEFSTHEVAAKSLAPVLNKVLGRGSFVVSRGAEGIQRKYASREGRPDGLLAIALAASELLAERDPKRLRDCRSERCVLLFYDSTKSGTRQWCRQECMNRSRARENYRRAKGTEPL